MLLVTDTNNNKIRHVSRITSEVSTFVASQNVDFRPLGITQHSVTGKVYVTSHPSHLRSSPAIYSINYHTRHITALESIYMNFGAGRTHVGVHYFQFNEPRDLLLIDNGRLLVVADYGANKVLVHNVSSGFVNSICKFSQDAGSADGTYRQCKFTRPWGLMVDGDSLYVGTSYGLLKTGQDGAY